MPSKLTEADKDFIIKLAETGDYSLEKIKEKLATDRKVVINSKQTVKDVIDKYKSGNIKKKPKPEGDSDGEQSSAPVRARVITHADGVRESPPPEEFDKDDSRSGSNVGQAEMHHTGSPASKIQAALAGGSTTAIYAAFIEYCRTHAVGNEVIASMLRNCEDYKRHWRAIVIYTIDIIRDMERGE